MSRCPDIPIHTENVMLSLSKAPASFNNLLATLGLSPSTLSRILRFLRTGRLIEVSIYDRWAALAGPGKDVDGRTSPRKLLIYDGRTPTVNRDKGQILKFGHCQLAKLGLIPSRLFLYLV